jgi:hypothetical protein
MESANVVVQHHINKEMCVVSVVFPLICPTPVGCYVETLST